MRLDRTSKTLLRGFENYEKHQEERKKIEWKIIGNLCSVVISYYIILYANNILRLLHSREKRMVDNF